MSKMPEWIAKFNAEQLQLKKKQVMDEKQRAIEHEKVQETIGYKISPNHPIVREYVTALKEKHKKQKKREKKLKNL